MRTRYCIVSSCPNFLGTTDPSIQFFISPQFDQKLLGKWKQVVNCKQSKFRLCILHFRKEDIVRSGKRISLRKEAVPVPAAVPEPEILFADVPFMESVETKEVEPIVSIKKEPVEPELLRQFNSEDNNIDNSVDVLSMERIEMRDIEPIAPIKEELADSKLLCPFCIDYDIQLKAARTKIASLEKRLCEANIKIKRLENVNQTEDIKYDISHIKEEPIDQEEDNLDDELIEVIPIDESSSDDSLLPDSLHDTVAQEHISDQASVMKSEDTDTFNETIKFLVQPSSLTTASYKPVENILKLFQCARCNSAFASALELSSHISRHRRSYECFLCKTKFDMASKLRIHMIVHEKGHRCKVCRIPFTANELIVHLCGDRRTIRCDYCENEFMTTLALLDHIESSHEDKKFYGCEKCPKFYPMLALKDIHVESHARDVPKPFECKTCSSAFATNEHLKRHIERQHERNKSHLCDLCGKSFPCKRNLELHMNSSIHSDQPQFKCPDCPQTFFKSYDLKKHSDIHKNDKYVCEVCKKELLSTMAYRKHMKKHQRTEADRRFQCKLCTMKFFSANNLRSHRAVHTGKRSFKCQFCDQSYKYSGDLNKHLKIHLGDKIHECKKCQQRFQYPLELRKHEFQHYKADKEANKIAD